MAQGGEGVDRFERGGDVCGRAFEEDHFLLAEVAWRFRVDRESSLHFFLDADRYGGAGTPSAPLGLFVPGHSAGVFLKIIDF